MNASMPSVAACPRATERRTAMAAVAAIVLGIGLRITGLEVHSLWADEGSALHIAIAPDLMEALKGSRHPPLSFLLFRGWVALFGEGDAALRMLPALLSCASLLLFTRLAWLWLPGWSRAGAVALYAVAPFHVWYGQEVTPYAFLELGSVLAAASLASALCVRRAAPIHLLGVVAGVGFAFGSQYLGGLAGVSTALVAAAAAVARRISWRSAAALTAAAMTAGLIWLPWILPILPAQMASDWGDEAKVSLRDLAELPVRLLLVDASVIPPHWRFLGFTLGAIVWLGIVAHGIRVFVRRVPEDLWIVLWFAGAVAGSLALVVVTKPNLLPRYLVAASPAVALATAGGLGRLRGKLPRGLTGGGLLVALVVAGCLSMTVLQKLENRREDFRTACSLLVSRWKPGDHVLVVTGQPGEAFSQAPVRHYLRDHPPILASMRDLPDVLPRLDRAFPPGTTIHVIYRVAEYAAAARNALGSTLHLVEESPALYRVRYLRLEPVER